MIEASPNKAQMTTVPLKSSQLKLLKRGGEHAVIPKFENVGNMTTMGETDARDPYDENDNSGRDMDQESTTQNFLSVARQGYLSPRHIEKVKSAAKGRKKQHKDTSTVPVVGVQTRRTLTKSRNQ